MAVNYNITATNARLVAVGSFAGNLVLKGSAGTLATVANSYGGVDGGVLTYSPGTTGTVSVTGTVTSGWYYSAASVPAISILTVGLPVSGKQIEINNSSNSTVITAGQSIQFMAGQITSPYT
jgi:hypothetical protein